MDRIRVWLKIIAIWFLLYAFVDLAFYIYIQSPTVNIELSNLDQLVFFISFVGSLTVFVGIWTRPTLGWKFAIIYIPISWMVSLVDIFDSYEAGEGYVLSLFAFMDAVILSYLFRFDVKIFLNVAKSRFNNLFWLVSLFFVIGIFLLANELLGSVFAILVVASLLLGFQTAYSVKKKHRKEDARRSL